MEKSYFSVGANVYFPYCCPCSSQELLTNSIELPKNVENCSKAIERKVTPMSFSSLHWRIFLCKIHNPACKHVQITAKYHGGVSFSEQQACDSKLACLSHLARMVGIQTARLKFWVSKPWELQDQPRSEHPDLLIKFIK